MAAPAGMLHHPKKTPWRERRLPDLPGVLCFWGMGYRGLCGRQYGKMLRRLRRAGFSTGAGEKGIDRQKTGAHISVRPRGLTASES